MSRNSRNPFSKVEIGSKFTVSGTAAFKHDWDYETGQTSKRWYNFPLDSPKECYFVGTKTLYEGEVVGTMVYDDLTGEYLPGLSKLVNRRPRWAAMFAPVNGVQYRAPLMTLVGKCAMDGCDAPVVGHTCCPECEKFLDPVDFEIEELESDKDAMDRICGKPEVAWFNLPDVIGSWDDDQAWKEAWEYGYLVGHEDLPYRPLDCAHYEQGPYDYSYGWKTPMHNGFKSGLWAGEADRKAGRSADWTIYIPF